MKKRTRIVSLLLALLLTAPLFAGCSESGTNSEDESNAQTESGEIETAPEEEDSDDRTKVKDGLPDGLNYDGTEIGVFVPDVKRNEMYFAGPEEMTGEVVDDAVFARNLSVEERLNITLKQDGVSGVDGGNINTNVYNLIMAGDTTYDLYLGQQFGITKLLTEKCFINAYDINYIDFSRPWWNTYYMEELTLGKGYLYFLIGDYFLDSLDQERVIFFNKNIYNNIYGNADRVYEEVIEGKWTLDRMCELSEGAFIDLDGNGQTDETDQLGYVTYWHGSSVDALVYGTDIDFTKRDADGFITLDIVSDRAVLLLEKILKLYYQPGSWEWTDGRNVGIFASGTALFLGNAAFGMAPELREMEDDFGFIPYPKLDEQQDSYHSLVHDAVLIGAVSTCSINLDKIGAVLEALNSESYRTVTPAWYETALKNKYSRDKLSLQMIDLVHDSMRTNFAFAYNYSLNNAGLLFRDLVGANSSDLASKAKSLTKAANKMLDKLTAAFKEQTGG